MLQALIAPGAIMPQVQGSGKGSRMAWARWIIRKVALTAGVGGAALVGYLAFLHYSGNFHKVLANELYRSAQISDAELADYRSRYGIRSVLNLRGAAPGEPWYEEEVAATKALGLTHVDFPMNASKDFAAADATRLIALMREMPKPLLVHCRHGSDRTGLAVSLYLAAITGASEDEAEGALSLWYGHFSVPYLSAAYPMDQSWERLEPGLGFAGS
jgi:protein tyrosine/serine phosphatase